MAATLRASRQGLTIVDQARKKKGWNKEAVSLCGKKHHLKRFWRSIPIDRDVFVEICQNAGIVNWEEIVDNNPKPKNSQVDFFSYNDGWVGREELVAELTNKVHSSCRILMLVGITGIGKTALAERLAVELQEDWLQGD